jgi:phosphatidylcholine synthase
VFAFDPPGVLTALLVVVCIGLTFVRLKWVHPMRVTRLRTVTAAATAAWALAGLIVVYRGFPAGMAEKVVLAAVAIYGLSLSVLFGRDDRPLV